MASREAAIFCVIVITGRAFAGQHSSLNLAQDIMLERARHILRSLDNANQTFQLCHALKLAIVINLINQPARFGFIAHAARLRPIEDKFADRFDEEVYPCIIALFQRIVDCENGFRFAAMDLSITPSHLAKRKQFFSVNHTIL